MTDRASREIERLVEFLATEGQHRSDDWKRRVRLQILRWMWIRAQQGGKSER